MFDTFLDWREKNQADIAMWTYFFPNLQEARDMYNHGYHQTDKEGRPIYLDRPCMFEIDELEAIWPEEKCIKYYVREYEKLIHVRLPACSAAKGEKVERTMSVLDINGFGMSKLNRRTIHFIKIAINIGSDYYPEIMGCMFIINAPFLFTGAWRVISPFIDEKTRRKIHILGGSYLPRVLELVDEDKWPKELGGKCDCAEGCFYSDVGPWNEHPGDDFGEEAKRKKEEIGFVDEQGP